MLVLPSSEARQVRAFSFPRRPRTDTPDATTVCALTLGETRRHLHHPKPPAMLADAANIGDAVLKPGWALFPSIGLEVRVRAASVVAEAITATVKQRRAMRHVPAGQQSRSRLYAGRLAAAPFAPPKRATPASRSLIMRTILAIAGLLLASLSLAQGIPSDASGVYLGNDRACRIVLSRYQAHWINVDLRCLTFAGAATVVNATRYSPGACLGDGAIQIDGQTGAGFLSLRSYANGSLSVAIDPSSVNASNGVGYSDTWTRVGTIQSPAPYTCGNAAPITRPQLCGEFGWFCG